MYFISLRNYTDLNSSCVDVDSKSEKGERKDANYDLFGVKADESPLLRPFITSQK